MKLSSMVASDFEEQIIQIVNSNSLEGLNLALENKYNKKVEVGSETPVPNNLTFPEETDKSKKKRNKKRLSSTTKNSTRKWLRRWEICIRDWEAKTIITWKC